jgi:DNA-binding beta-propeller fold protein YncE
VTNSNASTVSVIDIESNTVESVIGGFDGPSGLTIVTSQNGLNDIGYVNNYGGPNGVGSGNGTTVQKVNLTTRQLIGTPIVVGLAPAAIQSSPDGQFVYTVNYVDGNNGTGSMSIINTTTGAVIVTAVKGFSGPFAFTLDSKGERAYVTNFGSNNFAPYGSTMSVVQFHDGLQPTIIKTIALGIQPSGVALIKDRYVAVSNYNTLYAGSGFTLLTPGQGTVQLIDTCSLEVVGKTVLVGQSPAQIAFDCKGKNLYVTNYTSNTVSWFPVSAFGCL